MRSSCCRLTLDEIAAAAELILAQDDAEDKQEASGSESSDEGFGGEVESDSEEDHVELNNVEDLADSGYGAKTAAPSSAMEIRLLLFTLYSGSIIYWPLINPSSSALDEMGADALLCLATGSKN